MENSHMQIILSSRLREILHKVNDNISKFILSLEDNNDYTYQYSFLDVTEDEGAISFINVNKYNELPKIKGNGDMVWSCPTRNEIKIGRLMNKIAPFYKANEIEKCVNSFKAEYKNSLKNIKFEVIEGSNILKYYNGKRYARGNGSLNKSCMRHDHCAEWMQIYIKNPDKIKMLVLLENKDVISGRALLWKLDEPADTWLLDRIYVKEDSDAILFKKYAEKNGWLYKSAQTFDNVNVIKNEDELYIDMKVKVSGDYKYFPYLDSLFYFNQKDKYLTNSIKDYENDHNTIKLREINGNDSGNENFVFDNLNGDHINIEDSTYCYYGDGYTHKNNAVFVKEFDEYCYPTELRYSTHHKRFLNSSSFYSKNIGSFLMESDVYVVYLDKEMKTYDYFFRNFNNMKFSKIGNNYFIMDILVKGIDENYYFKDEYDPNSILNNSDKESKILGEVINSSEFVRKNMGIKKIKKGIFSSPTYPWQESNRITGQCYGGIKSPETF